MRAVETSKRRMLVFSVALQSHFLRIDDARELVMLIEDGTDRVGALKALYPRLVDRRRFHQLLSLVERSADLEALLGVVEATEVSPEAAKPVPVIKD